MRILGSQDLRMKLEKLNVKGEIHVRVISEMHGSKRCKGLELRVFHFMFKAEKVEIICI